MPGRAFEYMNQNIGLTQGGLDRARGVGEAAVQQEARDYNRQWMTEQRAFERGEQPASPFQKWTAQQVIKKWFDRKDLPPQTRAAAAKAELHALKNAGQLQGDAADPSQDLQPGKQMQVQLPGGSDGAAPGGVPGMSWRNPAGMAAAAPPPIQATAEGRQMQVSLPGEMTASLGRDMQGEQGPSMVDMSGMFPRTIDATGAQQPAVPPPPSFLVTRSPEGQQGSQGAPSAGSIGGGMAGAQPVPEVKTVRDFNDVLSANREIERWQPGGTGLTFEQRQEMERLKQQGPNYRAGVRSQTADKDRAAQAHLMRLKIASREKMFWRSTQNIDNALLLLQTRLSFIEQVANSSEIDKNLRTQMVEVGRLIMSKGRELAELHKRMEVNQRDPRVEARKLQLMRELGDLSEFMADTEDQMGTNPNNFLPIGFDGPQEQGSGGGTSRPESSTSTKRQYSIEE